MADTNMVNTQKVRIDVVSDVVCPWCFLGQRRLEKAISDVPEIDVTVGWRPLQLDPTIPADGIERKAYMLAKFGSEDRLRDAHARIESLGRELFSAYFEQGRDIGDHGVLADIAHLSGMDRPVVESLLASGVDREAVAEEAATASRMGVTGVPCFLLERKYAVMGAQEASTLSQAIREIAAARTRGELEA